VDISEETKDSSVEADAPTSFSTETPVTAEVAEKKPRKPLTVGGHAVGRRKQAIARVRLVPGTGSYTVNGRTLEQYFPQQTSPAAHQRPVHGLGARWQL